MNQKNYHQELPTQIQHIVTLEEWELQKQLEIILKIEKCIAIRRYKDSKFTAKIVNEFSEQIC